MSKRTVGEEEAERIGGWLGVDWTQIDLDQFRRGMEVEFEHGSRDPATDVTHDDPVLTGKIAWAHLKEFPDYYTRLDRLEAEADAYWTSRRTAALSGRRAFARRYDLNRFRAGRAGGPGGAHF